MAPEATGRAALRPVRQLRPLHLWHAADRRQLRGVFTDIDDTLTTDGAITPDALAALHALHAAGLRVIAITGRPIGWCAPFANTWPVDAMVAENGAVAFVRGQIGPQATPVLNSSLLKLYQLDASTRAGNFRRMQAVAQRLLREVPGAKLAQDSAGRETDIAIDHSEFTRLPPEQIAQVVQIMQAEGMTATVSSIHINGWYGSHNKLVGARWIVQQLYQRELDAELAQWAYVGDSANDQLMFQHFAHSVGVANILGVAAQLAHLPRYVTASERGAGFAEVAAAVLSAKRAEPPVMNRPAGATRGLVSIFGSTFVELIGYFMLLPMLLFQLKTAGVSTSLAGLFAATGYLGMFLMTPFASAVTQRLGRRATLWLAAALPALAAVGFALTDALAVWFVLKLVSGAAAGLRWVLAEALIAEFSPPGQRGRYVGIFETLVGFTFVIGPAVLAWLGTDNPHALWWVIGFLLTGLAWSLLIPPLPRADDAHSARVGLGGVWHALLAHPIIMLAGFMGGFFESGMASILPLYGLALGLGAATAALLVSCIGLGSALTMLPAGLLADRFDDQARGRRTLMLVCAAVTLAAAALVPLVPQAPWLVWPIVFIWGGAGGSLYTMAMIDIGAREKGITLVNSTAVLVLTYTLGGLAASSLSGALIDWSPTLGFPLVLLGVAAVGLAVLLRTRHRQDI